MPDYPNLYAEPRSVTGKAVRHLRREGVTPVVVYGAKSGAVPLQVRTKELVELIHRAGGTHLIAMQVAGEDRPRMVLTRAVQRHVTRLTPLHADFLEVDVHKPVTSVVPVAVAGTAEPVSQGIAVLDLMVSQVTVEALPTDLPSAIHVDASRLRSMEDTVHVRDLVPGAKVRILDDADELVVRLAPVRIIHEEEEEAIEAAEVPLVGEHGATPGDA